MHFIFFLPGISLGKYILEEITEYHFLDCFYSIEEFNSMAQHFYEEYFPSSKLRHNEKYLENASFRMSHNNNRSDKQQQLQNGLKGGRGKMADNAP